MLAPSYSSSNYSFGVFEADVRRNELLKNGQRVKIQDKPFQLLLILLERPGEIVTRDEVRTRLWSADTFVEFDDALNVVANKLRAVLGDSADDPRFVETVPRRGYRFIAPVTKLQPDRSVNADQAAEPVATVPASSRVRELTAQPAPSAWGKRLWIFVFVVACVALSSGVYLYRHRAPTLTDKDTLVLADFTNSTGDPLFDETLRQGTAVQLEQSPFLSLVSDERIGQTLRLMGQPADARLTPDAAREVCERVGSAVVLDGSIASLGTQYVVGLRARNCHTGDVLDQEQAQASQKEEVLNALSEIVTKFRRRAGESLATIQKYDTPLPEATTPSLEALKAYSAGRKVAFADSFVAALPFLTRAVEIDPQFAMAHAFLGRVYGDIGESVLSSESTERAYQLRNRVSEREKFFITVSYHRQVTGNLEKSYENLQLWAQNYPRDPDVHGLLSGFTTQGSGRYEQSIEEAKRATALDPTFVPGYLNRAFSHFYLDQLNEAEQVIQQASEHKLDPPEFVLLRYYIAFLREDEGAMQRAVSLAKDRPGALDWMSSSEALVLARSGRLFQAKKKFRVAVDEALQADQHERAATWQAAEAVSESLLGDVAGAKRSAAAALKLSNGRDAEFAAAFALALSGEDAHAQTLASDLEKRFPQDTSVVTNYLPHCMHSPRSTTMTLQKRWHYSNPPLAMNLA
jgi:DNA-binding winged helix-turn-helix (wHTH) protein/tetratricopeptide (TPR) repeat protein